MNKNKNDNGFGHGISFFDRFFKGLLDVDTAGRVSRRYFRSDDENGLFIGYLFLITYYLVSRWSGTRAQLSAYNCENPFL